MDLPILTDVRYHKLVENVNRLSSQALHSTPSTFRPGNKRSFQNTYDFLGDKKSPPNRAHKKYI